MSHNHHGHHDTVLQPEDVTILPITPPSVVGGAEAMGHGQQPAHATMPMMQMYFHLGYEPYVLLHQWQADNVTGEQGVWMGACSMSYLVVSLVSHGPYVHILLHVGRALRAAQGVSSCDGSAWPAESTARRTIIVFVGHFRHAGWYFGSSGTGQHFRCHKQRDALWTRSRRRRLEKNTTLGE